MTIQICVPLPVLWDTPMNDQGLQPALVRQAFASWSAYQRDWTMTPECSVCGLHFPTISTIAPKSLQDSWETRQ